MASPGQRRALARAQTSTHRLAAVGIARGIGESILAASGEITKAQRIVGKVFAEKQLTPQERTRIHEDVGAAARRSLVAGYTHRNPRKGTPPYRITAKDPRNNRLAGGILRRALQSPSMVRATADSLLFIDTSVLDREARHWRRINFGAGAGGVAPTQFEVRWGNLVLGSIGLAADTRPAFFMPKGFWLSPGAAGRASGRGPHNEFYPVGEVPSAGSEGRRLGAPRRPRQPSSIAATNFIDAGVRRIATELPRAYVGAVRALYEGDRSRFKQIAAEVDVPIRVFRPNTGAAAFRPGRG